MSSAQAERRLGERRRQRKKNNNKHVAKIEPAGERERDHDIFHITWIMSIFGI